MGYQHRVRKATCGNCNRKVVWSWKGSGQDSNKWECDCGRTNYLKALPDLPQVPHVLYIGPEKLRRLKIYPVPPECPDEDWVQPYSTRSFVYQASRELQGCHYSCSKRGVVMGEPVYRDRCYDPTVDEDWPDTWDCHLIG